MKSYIKVGDVVSFDYDVNTIGWIAVVIKRGFINPYNKYEHQMLVQPRKIKNINETEFILGDKYGCDRMQIVKQATKCRRLDKYTYKLKLCDVIDNTYSNRRQLTNQSKINIYKCIIDNLQVCAKALILESELLTSTEYIKTKFANACVDIPNPLASLFKTKMKNVNLFTMTLQNFLIKYDCHDLYDFVWVDLCKSIIGDQNSEILPLIMKENIILYNGYLAITCCLRGCDYDKTMRIINTYIGKKYEIVIEMRYQGAMLFMMFKKL